MLLKCVPSDATFYLFPDVSEAIDGINSDSELAEHLIENAGVAIVPGSAFGLDGYARLSIATSMENLTKALDRIEAVLTS